MVPKNLKNKQPNQNILFLELLPEKYAVEFLCRTYFEKHKLILFSVFWKVFYTGGFYQLHAFDLKKKVFNKLMYIVNSIKVLLYQTSWNNPLLQYFLHLFD